MAAIICKDIMPTKAALPHNPRSSTQSRKRSGSDRRASIGLPAMRQIAAIASTKAVSPAAAISRLRRFPPAGDESFCFQRICIPRL